MALLKNKELANGFTGNYWVAQSMNNMQSKKTDVIMLLYKDKASRDAHNTFLERVRVNSIDGIYLTGEQVYAGVKASVKEERIVPEVLDEEGNVVTAESTEEVETNWFADAEDEI